VADGDGSRRDRWSQARILYGVLLVLFPRVVVRAAAGDRADATPGLSAVARMLGARHVLQALLVERAATPVAVLAGSGVDVIHAASMLVAAHLDQRRARVARVDAMVAAGFAAAGAGIAARRHAAMLGSSAPPRDRRDHMYGPCAGRE
jgi:hypothetical protein